MTQDEHDNNRVYAWYQNGELKLRWFAGGQKPDQRHFMAVYLPREVRGLWHEFLQEKQDDPGFHWVEAFFREFFLEGARGGEFDQPDTFSSLRDFLGMPDFDRLVSPLLTGTTFAGHIVDACQAIYQAGTEYGPRFSANDD